jgi:deazaflavin-dependent oxidoreductase (nitroreductase family)
MRLIDRVTRVAVRLGLGGRSTALLETTGRVSGQPRITPVTNGLDGDRFWLVTEHGERAQYVRNLRANPYVRVFAGRRWHDGIAHVVDEDPEERLRQIAAHNPRARANTAIVRRSDTRHLVVRIDLTRDIGVRPKCHLARNDRPFAPRHDIGV